MKEPLFWISADMVHQRIEELSLKRWWVAEYSGVHKTTLRRWLRGRIRKIRLSNLERLARVLETECSKLGRPVTEGYGKWTQPNELPVPARPPKSPESYIRRSSQAP